MEFVINGTKITADVPTPSTTLDASMIDITIQEDITGEISEDISGVKHKKDKNFSECCSKCQKLFVSRSGRWRHENKCTYIPPTPEPITTLANMVTPAIVASLQELHQKVDTIQSKSTVSGAPVVNQIINTPSVVNNNTINATFNNNVNLTVNYLNANCKDAMTIGEFIERLEFKRSDYEIIERNPRFIKGAKVVLHKHMSEIPVEKRPIHCTPEEDNRPATFFVKNSEEWTHECQGLVDYIIRRGKFEKDESHVATVKFIRSYIRKFDEGMKTLSPSEKIGLSTVDGKFCDSKYHAVLTELLDYLVDKKYMTISNPTEETVEFHPYEPPKRIDTSVPGRMPLAIRKMAIPDVTPMPIEPDPTPNPVEISL